MFFLRSAEGFSSTIPATRLRVAGHVYNGWASEIRITSWKKMVTVKHGISLITVSTLSKIKIALEHGPFILSFTIKNGAGFPTGANDIRL